MFTLSEFLASEVKPALGCTEPGAVALAVAKAREQLGCFPEKLDVEVSDSIYKNGIAVGVPGTDGLKGNEIAAALSVVAGDSALGLEVLRPAGADDLVRAKEFLSLGKLHLWPNGKPGVYVRASACADGHCGEAVIKDSHANLVSWGRDGLLEFAGANGGSGTVGPSIAEQVRDLDFEELTALADQLTEEDQIYLLRGVEMNAAIAEYGFSHQVGLQLGNTVKRSCGDRFEEDLAGKVKAWSAAASDARMAGVNMPVMSSAGSGNHGITAILPVWVVARHCGLSDEETAKALAYSHLATSFVKSRMGRLSPVCGCAVAAGAGAAAGMVRAMGGTARQAQKAMELVIGNIVGMVCDGAKESCALKVGTGAGEAFYAAQLAMAGGGMSESQGVVDVSSLRQTADNAARFNAEGMAAADKTLIDIISRRAQPGGKEN